MHEAPGLQRDYQSRAHSSTAIVPPRRYSIKRLTELRRQCSAALDLEKISHAALQAGVLKREILLPYITMVDGPLSEVPINYGRGLATVPTRTRRPTDDWTLLPDNVSPQISETTSAVPDNGLAKQDEGFAKFLKTHSSPTHQRVTAGGRIVPMEAPPPPEFKGFGNGNTDADAFNQPLPGLAGNFRSNVREMPRHQFLQNRSGAVNERLPAVGLSGQDNNRHFSSPLIAPSSIATPSLNSTAWWGPSNQQRLGAVPTYHSPFPLNGYSVPTYPSTTSQSSLAAGLVDFGNGPTVLDIPQGPSHNSSSSPLPPLMVSPLPTPAQPIHSNGSGMTFTPFLPPANATYPYYQAPPTRVSMPGHQASYSFTAPDGRTNMVANLMMPLNINGLPPSPFPTTVDQARQEYKAITERIEQFNKEVVLQNPALDNVQQSAIAKYRLDMATERARAHKHLKTLEATAELNNPDVSEASIDEKSGGNVAGSKFQSRLSTNSPSRGLNVEAPIWKPRNFITNSTASHYSLSEQTVTDPKTQRKTPPRVRQEKLLFPIQAPESTTRPITKRMSMNLIGSDTAKSQGDVGGGQLPRVTGVGPLGSAGYPIPELLSMDGSDDKSPHKLLMWTDGSGRRTDQIPPQLVAYYQETTDETIRAMRAGEEPNLDKIEKPPAYDYFMDWEPINEARWKIMSGHFGVRKALREEYASESHEKRKRGPEGTEMHEWDKRFDAARHYRGVETTVWTKKHGWLICQGQDLHPPDSNDDLWMTDYERRYWIRKPDSLFHKLRPGELRIEDMENTCDECSRLSIYDDATVYTEDPKWFDLLAQCERLIAAGEDVDMPRRSPPTEPYIRDGNRLSMEETKTLWRDNIEAGKKYRNEHKTHKSRRCPKHAKVKAAKEEQVRSWLSNTGGANPSAGSPHSYRDIRKSPSHSLTAAESPSTPKRQGPPVENVHRGVNPRLQTPFKLISDSDSLGGAYKQGWGYGMRNNALTSLMPKSSGYDPGRTNRLADHSNDHTTSPRADGSHQQNEAQRHKGASSVSLSPNVVSATAHMAAQRRFDSRTDLIQLLKNISTSKENETSQEPATERPISPDMDIHPRFPFQGNLSR